MKNLSVPPAIPRLTSCWRRISVARLWTLFGRRLGTNSTSSALQLDHGGRRPPFVEELAKGLPPAALLTQLVGPPALGAAVLGLKVDGVVERIERAPAPRTAWLGVAHGERLADRTVTTLGAADLDASRNPFGRHQDPPPRGGRGRRPVAPRAKRVDERRGGGAGAGGARVGRNADRSGSLRATTPAVHQAAASAASTRSPHVRLAFKSPRAIARRTDRPVTPRRTAPSSARSTAKGSRSSNGVSQEGAMSRSPSLSPEEGDTPRPTSRKG